MIKMSASASHGDRRAARARSTLDTAANERTTPQSPARNPALDAALDPEMLDLVQRFERGYAELAPTVEEPARQHSPSDELFPEFPDIFDEPPAAKPAAESARVFSMPRREAEAPPAQSAWSPETPAVDRGGDVDLDEAMAILRASEQRVAAPARTNVEEEPMRAPRAAPTAWRSDNVSVRSASSSSAESMARDVRPPSEASWTSRSHAARTLALAAAVAALVVGVAAGYMWGHSPSQKAPSAVIEKSGQGGTQLKLERSLPQR
jgi:hypothetical protein